MHKPSIEQLHREKTGKVSDKWASYLPYYQSLLAGMQDQAIDMLEIGVQNGGSLETWSRYFTQAKHIIGCDIDEKCRLLAYDDPRVKVVVGDANADGVFQEITQCSEGFDLIIDDGSHTSSDILGSFVKYFPVLRPNGVFIIEDTHTLYMNDWGGGILNEQSAYAFFKKLVDVLNFQFWKNELRLDVFFRSFFPLGKLPPFIAEGWIESIEFRNSLIVLRKSASANINKLGSRIITGQEAKVNPSVLKMKA